MIQKEQTPIFYYYINNLFNWLSEIIVYIFSFTINNIFFLIMLVSLYFYIKEIEEHKEKIVKTDYSFIEVFFSDYISLLTLLILFISSTIFLQEVFITNKNTPEPLYYAIFFAKLMMHYIFKIYTEKGYFKYIKYLIIYLGVNYVMIFIGFDRSIELWLEDFFGIEVKISPDD